MKTNKTGWILTLYLVFPIAVSSAQEKGLSYTNYLNRVKSQNISYIAEKYQVDIADANAQAAKIFVDPTLTFAYSNNQDKTLQMGQSYDAGVEYNLELGGKRKARIGIAEIQKEITRSLVEDYFRNLRSDASITYLNALKQKQILAIETESYTNMMRISRGDSIRYRLGQIKQVDAMQSKLEANSMNAELEQSRLDYKNAMIDVSHYMGNQNLSGLDSIEGRLPFIKKGYVLEELISEAVKNRSDLLVALKSVDLSEKNLRLAKANRIIDLGISMNYTQNSTVRNDIAPAPAYHAFTAGISIPLKLSNINRGQIRAAESEVNQSRANLEAASLQIRKEVIQAYGAYVTSCRNVEMYKTEMLADAGEILTKKGYSYQRGETSLLDLLNAQRTYNEISKSYCEALMGCLTNLINLQRAAGVWDLEPFL